MPEDLSLRRSRKRMRKVMKQTTVTETLTAVIQGAPACWLSPKMRKQKIPGFLHGHHRIDKLTNVAHQNFPLFDRKSVKRISDLAQKLLNTAINLAHSPTPSDPSNRLAQRLPHAAPQQDAPSF